MKDCKLVGTWMVLAITTMIAIGGCSNGGGGGDNGSGTPFTNPPEIASANGVLSTTITMEAAVQTVADEEVTFPALFNGLYTPPTLNVQPGDTVKLTFRNFGVEPTNLHYHGLGVTPPEQR